MAYPSIDLCQVRVAKHPLEWMLLRRWPRDLREFIVAYGCGLDSSGTDIVYRNLELALNRRNKGA